jgi:hypothetical protein
LELKTSPQVREALNGGPIPNPQSLISKMILGVGSDLIDIRRIERSLARFGSS